jgi:TPP-dependent pyruvate/acetoin dehydrogenase alpha subunit
MEQNYRREIFKRASLSRNFENETFKQIQKKNIKFPVYLSAGQEYIAATISHYVQSLNVNPDIFIQHRGHSTYLSFGGDPIELVDELLGRKSGCANGMGGSASIQCKDKNIYGHDGLMGSNVTIGTGSCYASKRPTIVFVGDSAIEEDYAITSLGWAVTKDLPILFVVEDNNLSILTEKKVRRTWDIHDVARGFGMKAFNIPDSPETIREHLDGVFTSPLLLNINTIRKYWHSGAGIDDDDVFDRYEYEMNRVDNGKEMHEKYKQNVEKLWKNQLEKR